MAAKAKPKDKMIQVAVRMTRDQQRKVRKAARVAGESFSAYVRRKADIQ